MDFNGFYRTERRKENFIDSKESQKPNDEILGEMTEEEKELFTSWMQLNRKTERYYYRYLADRENTFLKEKYLQFGEKAISMGSRFFSNVKKRFNLPEVKNIRIRKGFLIVLAKED